MDTTVAHLGAILVAALRRAGYMESTIGNYQKTIRLLDDFVAGRGGEYFPSLGAEFAGLTTSPRTGRFSAVRRFNYMRLVALFDSYLRSGEVDLGHRKRGGGGRWPQSSEFQGLNASWEEAMVQWGLAIATREAYGRVARGYLTYLEDQGITRLDAADAVTVTGFFASLLDRWAQSSLFWQVSNFRPFLKFLGRHDLVEALNLIGARRSYPILPDLSDEAVVRVVDACASSLLISSRDAAITLLSLLLGLRACDIVTLRLGDISWRTQTISFVQQKTKNPLVLPLPGVLVARLGNYVLAERPNDRDQDHVFLRSVAPYAPLVGHTSIYVITSSVFGKAGVTDVKAGTRLLRHAAASRLLRAATPLPTIAAVLGHASQESTNIYLSVDEERLVQCVLPVPKGAVS